MVKKSQTYIVSVYDAYGQPVMETYEITPFTQRQRLKIFLAALIGYKWAYRLGLSQWKPISGITVKDQ